MTEQEIESQIAALQSVRKALFGPVYRRADAMRLFGEAARIRGALTASGVVLTESSHGIAWRRT